MDMDKVCRCCLNPNTKLRNMNFLMEINGVKETISDFFLHCLNITIASKDSLPQNICMFCITTLQISFSFKTIVENSQKVLSNYIEDKVMQEDTKEEVLNAPSKPVNIEPFSSQIDFEDENIEEQYEQNEYSSTVKEESNEIYYYCTVCSSKFLEQMELYDHCCTEHPVMKMEGAPCGYCNERFDNSQSLLIHKTKHLTPYICPRCWKGYTEEERLTTHKTSCKKNIKLQEKPLKIKKARTRVICHVCGKSVPHDYMNDHLLVHGERKRKCEFCDKSFKNYSQLKSHIIWTHIREKKFKCDFCENMFMTSSSKSTHVRNVHMNERKFACELCEKRFFGSSGLKKHMLCHSGVKNFVCDYCNKAYQRRDGLNVHLKTNHVH